MGLHGCLIYWVNIPVYMFTLIGVTNHIRNLAIVKPANAPQSGFGLDNDSISYEK